MPYGYWTGIRQESNADIVPVGCAAGAALGHLADRAEMADTISFPRLFSFHFCPAARTNGFLIDIQVFP